MTLAEVQFVLVGALGGLLLSIWINWFCEGPPVRRLGARDRRRWIR